MAKIKELLVKAVLAKAKAKESKCIAEIKILQDSPSGIGEHTLDHYVDDLYRAYDELKEVTELIEFIELVNK